MGRECGLGAAVSKSTRALPKADSLILQSGVTLLGRDSTRPSYHGGRLASLRLRPQLARGFSGAGSMMSAWLVRGKGRRPKGSRSSNVLEAWASFQALLCLVVHTVDFQTRICRTKDLGLQGARRGRAQGSDAMAPRRRFEKEKAAVRMVIQGSAATRRPVGAALLVQADPGLFPP